MRRSLLLAVSVVLIVIVAASIAGVLIYLNNPHSQLSNGGTSQQGTGQLPVWYTFDNVFSANCNPGNCFGGGYQTSSDCQYSSSGVVTCLYQGASYYGYVGGYTTSIQYCNISPNGAIPSVNGTLVPYLGCVLSRAPLTQLFSDLYTLGGSGSSIQMWGTSFNHVTVFPTANFQSYSCSYQPMGTLTCNYLGNTYSGGTTNACNLGTPIQVNGEAVPSDACLLQRA